jgi:hypothetical protein
MLKRVFLALCFVAAPSFALAQQGGGVVGVPPFSGCAEWTAPNIITGTTSSCGGGGGGSPGGSAGDIQDNNGAGGFGAAALNDNGTIIKSTESIDTKTNATVWEIANESGTGTTVNKLAFLTGAPSTAKIQPTASQVGALGIVIGGAGTTGTAQIAITGQASCVFDGATTAGHYVTSSTGTAGDCHDAGAGEPNAVTVVGIVLSTNASAGTFGVSLFPPTENSVSGSAGSATKPCTSTANSIQYGLGSTVPTFACAPAIVNSGVFDFTGNAWQANNASFFTAFVNSGNSQITDFFLGWNSGAAYAVNNSGSTCIGSQACSKTTNPSGAATALGYNSCGAEYASNSSPSNVCVGDFAGYGVFGGSQGKNTIMGSGAGEEVGGQDNAIFGFGACPGVRGVGATSDSTCVGYLAGQGINGGDGNVLIGFEAGASLVSGNENICITATATSPGCGTLATGNGDIMLQAGAGSACDFSSTSVSNEFDLCSDASSGATPIVRANMTSIAAGWLHHYVPDSSPAYTVATLPAAPPTGSRAYVTDAVVCTFLGALTGSGSAFCPVIFNGASWQGG